MVDLITQLVYDMLAVMFTKQKICRRAIILHVFCRRRRAGYLVFVGTFSVLSSRMAGTGKKYRNMGCNSATHWLLIVEYFWQYCSTFWFVTWFCYMNIAHDHSGQLCLTSVIWKNVYIGYC